MDQNQENTPVTPVPQDSSTVSETQTPEQPQIERIVCTTRPCIGLPFENTVALQKHVAENHLSTPEAQQSQPDTAELTKVTQEGLREIDSPVLNGCTCKCHMAVKPLDESMHAESCYHCKPNAHKPPKQEAHPNLNAGNNNEDIKWAEKWKTPEERILACERYCEYVRRGRSKKYYPEADENTIRRYMEKYPEEFRAEKIRDAERAGFAYIESIGFKGMTGGIKGFNATTWIWITKNKLNWRDKVQMVEADDYETEWGDGEEKA
jgi:hypothetical protein